MNDEPKTASELKAFLVGAFPSFEVWWSELDGDDRLPGERITFHRVMAEFTVYFGKRRADFTEKQLASLGKMIDAAVEKGGELENAVSTCFLEHLHQIGGEHLLRRFLSAPSRRKLRS